MHLGLVFDLRCFVAISNLSEFTRFFLPNLHSQNFRVYKTKKVFSKSAESVSQNKIGNVRGTCTVKTK